MLKHRDFIGIHVSLNRVSELHNIYRELETHLEPNQKPTSEMVHNKRAARTIMVNAEEIAKDAGYIVSNKPCECGGICFNVTSEFWADYNVALDKAKLS